MLTALTLAAALALAADQEATAPAPAAPEAAQSKAAPKRRKVIRLEELKVEGRIQKPEAFYILQRSQLNFEELQRSESFLPKVEKSVEGAPF